jgi:hypothetical protein
MFESLESRTFLSDTPLPTPLTRHERHVRHEQHVRHLAHLRHTGQLVEPAATSSSSQGVTRAARRAVTNQLKVSPDGRSLTFSNGKPFFYMADTAWHLFNKLSREEADLYLETRAAQGFTVIQAEANARFRADRYGNQTFVDNDPTRPNEEFFENVDYMVRKANSLGMYVAFVPLDSRWAGNGTFNEENVYAYGKFLGRRYADAKIIWVLGGDIAGDKGAGVAMWRELAYGITRGAANRDASKVTLTFHPIYNRRASEWFANDQWLDFDAFQSGHGVNVANYNAITTMYNRSPKRPVMDMESGYEGIPAGIVAGNPRLTDHDVRKGAYWSLFAGSLGVQYGHHNVWQFVTSPSTRNLGTGHWRDSLETPGANSMSVLRRLMLSRPALGRTPDQSMLVGANYGGGDHIRAVRGGDRSYAMVYTAGGKAVTVDLNKLSGSQVEARWYNPRKGKSSYVGVFAKNGNRTFTSPEAGHDWMLILDDASKKYGKP